MTFQYHATKFAQLRSGAVSEGFVRAKTQAELGWTSPSSNTPYEYPWGKKTKNPFFVGPFPQPT